MILDRHFPEVLRLHAGIFRSDDPQFHEIAPAPHSAGLHWEIRDRSHP
jgi:hypothetical protein